MENITTLSPTLDLCYSPDDRVWYFQEFYTGTYKYRRQSVSYDSEDDALGAYSRQSIVWFPPES